MRGWGPLLAIILLAFTATFVVRGVADVVTPEPEPVRPTCSDPAAAEVWNGPTLVCVPPR